jgi:hypothetical protein
MRATGSPAALVKKWGCRRAGAPGEACPLGERASTPQYSVGATGPLRKLCAGNSTFWRTSLHQWSTAAATVLPSSRDCVIAERFLGRNRRTEPEPQDGAAAGRVRRLGEATMRLRGLADDRETETRARL